LVLTYHPIGFLPTPVVEKSSKKWTFLSSAAFLLVSDLSETFTASFNDGECLGL